MRRLASSFGVLGFLGVLAVHACSSESSTDDKKNNGGTGGDAGEGGAPAPGGASGSAGAGRGGASGTDAGGTSGTGGAAGAGDTAGQAGEATGGVSGSAGAGAGGQGGEGAVGPGDACTMCMDGSATVLQTDCATSPACTTWMACVRGCSDPECLDACDRATREVAPYQHVIYEAFCDACATDCAALEFCDRDCVDNINLVPTNTPPTTLAATGLYETPTATPDQVAPYARPFHPEYELWSDGAVKRRWAYIPPCERIGTGGINRWIFPVGTRMWKEFSIPSNGVGNTPVRVETRFIHRWGPGETDWIFASYQWPMDNSTVPTAQDATLAPDTGVMNANGTMHDIPSRAQCVQCHHQTLPDKVLGFSAVQLSHMEGGVTIRELADNGWLTNPSAPGMGGRLAREGYDPPGDAATQQALGYLHANCGNCHNIGTTHGENLIAMPTVPAARLQLMIGSLDRPEDTYVYTTLFDQPTQRPAFAGCDRIEPGSSAQSEVIMRMSRRDVQQMPPIGTEQVHMAAVQNLRAWIDSLPSTGTSTCVPPP
jgi:hypothetical protein